MPNVVLIAAIRRTCVATALALSISSVPAHAASVTVDGNLSDLTSLVSVIPVNDASYVNMYRGTDPAGNVDSPTSEYNNGFDISNVYAYYNWDEDTFYFGMQFYGTVGNSLPVGSTATNEGVANQGAGSNSKTMFDSNETYGMQLYLGSSTSDPQLLLYNVKGVNVTGADTVAAITNPYGLTIAHAVSESFNGVEFGVTGLRTIAAVPAPSTMTLRFSAGSGDTNSTSTAAEDYRLVTMQAVPVPAAMWLFGSGLLGLVAAARKCRKTA